MPGTGMPGPLHYYHPHDSIIQPTPPRDQPTRILPTHPPLSTTRQAKASCSSSSAPCCFVPSWPARWCCQATLPSVATVDSWYVRQGWGEGRVVASVNLGRDFVKPKHHLTILLFHHHNRLLLPRLLQRQRPPQPRLHFVPLLPPLPPSKTMRLLHLLLLLPLPRRKMNPFPHSLAPFRSTPSRPPSREESRQSQRQAAAAVTTKGKIPRSPRHCPWGRPPSPHPLELAEGQVPTLPGPGPTTEGQQPPPPPTGPVGVTTLPGTVSPEQGSNAGGVPGCTRMVGNNKCKPTSGGGVGGGGTTDRDAAGQGQGQGQDQSQSQSQTTIINNNVNGGGAGWPVSVAAPAPPPAVADT